MYNNTINGLRKPLIVCKLLNKENNYTKLFLLAFCIIFNTFSKVYAQNETSTLLDERDGKVYKTVKIGTQWWMAENLNIGTKVNGSSLGLFQTNNGIIEKYYMQDNDEIGEVYGGLYDWEEAMNYVEPSDKVPSGVQGICPCGWHIPSDEEWKILERYLGMAEDEIEKVNERGTNEGDKLKEVGNEHWKDQVESYATLINKGDNETGFTAIPAGNRYNYALIWGGGVGGGTSYWSATSATFNQTHKRHFPFIRFLYGSSSIIGRAIKSNYDGSKPSISVRCLKDPENIIPINKMDTKIKIYPNPTNDFLIIENASVSSYYKIHNSNGDKIFEIDNKSKNNSLKIDISKLEIGVYYLSGADINESFVQH